MELVDVENNQVITNLGRIDIFINSFGRVSVNVELKDVDLSIELRSVNDST